MKIQSSLPAPRPSAAIAARPTAKPQPSGDRWTPTPPLNPFRPLFGATSSLGTTASQGGLGGVLAGVCLLATVPADIADMVTRPLQLLAWPFAEAWYGIDVLRQKLGR